MSRNLPIRHGHTGTAHMLARTLQQDPFTQGPWQWGYIHAVHTSPNTVDLYLDGTQTLSDTSYLTTGVRYLSGYSPSVGDVVLVARGVGQSSTDRVVLGKLA